MDLLNGRTPVHRLPPELLSSVLALLDWEGRFRAAAVCRSWHACVMHSSTIWRTVSATTFSNVDFLGDFPEMLRRVLALSSPLDLSLYLDMDMGIDTAIVLCSQDAAMRTHLLRSVVLDLRFSSDFQDDDAPDVLFDSLCQGMPRLRMLSLLTQSSLLESLAVHTGQILLSGGAPHLSLVKLEVEDPQLLFGNNTFPTVTQLALSLHDGLSSTSLQSAFAIFPHVADLTLSLNEALDDASLAWTVALPRQLNNLGLQANSSPRYMSLLANSLDRCNIKHVWITDAIVREPAHALTLLESWVATSPDEITTFRIDHVDSNVPEDESDGSPFAKWRVDVLTDVDIYMWAGADCADVQKHPCCAVLGLPTDLAWPHCSPLITALTRLSLDETLFTLHPDFPPLPQLQVLTIGILAPRRQFHAHSGVFFLAREGREEYIVPALRVLELAAEWHPMDGCPMRVAPDVVREFIDQHMQYDAARLDKLLLRGVRLVETIPGEVAALLIHFKDVTWEEPRIRLDSVAPMQNLWFD